MELGDQHLLILLGELNPASSTRYTCPCFDMTPLTLNKSDHDSLPQRSAEQKHMFSGSKECNEVEE